MEEFRKNRNNHFYGFKIKILFFRNQEKEALIVMVMLGRCSSLRNVTPLYFRFKDSKLSHSILLRAECFLLMSALASELNSPGVTTSAVVTALAAALLWEAFSGFLLFLLSLFRSQRPADAKATIATRTIYRKQIEFELIFS